MYASLSLDWISLTYDKTVHVPTLIPLLDWHYNGAGRFGYKYAYNDQNTGAYYLAGGQSDDMGVHLVFPGAALSSLRSHFGGQDDAIVRALSAGHPTASRIDLALDIHEGEITPRRMKNALRRGTLATKGTAWRFIEGKRGDISGDTLYCGSPSSDRQLRAYDKAAELQIKDGAPWLRLELELRRLRAQNAFSSCAANGTAETIRGHMEDFIRWHNPEYERAIHGPATIPDDIPRKMSGRRRWLLGVVVQALAKEIREDVRFPELFAVAVKEELARIDKQQ